MSGSHDSNIININSIARTIIKVKVSVIWGKQQLVQPSYMTFDICWLREITLRQLLVHVVEKVDPRLSLIYNAGSITVHVIEHVDEVTSSSGKRKQTLGRTCVTILLDENTYVTMRDCSSREFYFDVKLIKIPEGHREVVNAFDLLRAAQSLDAIFLPPPRTTRNNTADDCLHNDILIWLERKGVGWSRVDVKDHGENFLDNITTALFPLMTSMFVAMSEKHNASKLLILLYIAT